MAAIAERIGAAPRVDRFSRPWIATLVALDVLAFLISAWAGMRVAQVFGHVTLDLPRVALSVAVSIALWLWLFKRLGLYERSFAMTMQDEIYATVAALSIGIAPQLVLFTLVPSLSSSRLVLLTSLGLSIATVTTMRAIAHRARQVELLDRERRLAVVGNPSRLRAACEELAGVPNTHLLTIPVDDLDLAMATENTSAPGAIESMPWFVKVLRWECDTLIFADVPDPRHVPALLAAARKWGLQIAFATPRIRAYAFQLDADLLGHQALIVPRPMRVSTPAARFVKRATDVVFALSLLAASAPVAVVCALALGEPLARAPFTGRDGLRLERFAFATRRGERTSSLGGWLVRLCLDRLPQLVNVLRGELSFVGPRPIDPDVVDAARAFNPRYGEREVVR
ncbi:MAG: sugar transferase, partial [Candidatus Eremiobacteraeota bacterium]|nr:sugar transferase [Candidatus Eremiobacteraeota bacterium]